jgi:DNA-binding beta-propeller fold protein YncE
MALCAALERVGARTLQPALPTVLPLLDPTVCHSPTAVAYRASDEAVVLACSGTGVLQVTADLMHGPHWHGVAPVQVIGSTITRLADPEQCGTPSNVAIRPRDGAVVATCAHYRSLGTILIANGSVSVLASPTECRSPMAVAFRPDSDAVLVACTLDGVLEISFATGSAARRPAVVLSAADCPSAAGVAVRTQDGAVIAACSTGVVQAVTSATGNVSVTVLVPEAQCKVARAVVVHPDGATVYAACELHTALLAVTNGTVTDLANGSMCIAPRDLVYRAIDDSVIVTCGGGSVLHVAHTTATVFTLAKDAMLCPLPSGVAMRPGLGPFDSGTLLVACMLTGGVVELVRAASSCPCCVARSPAPRR